MFYFSPGLFLVHSRCIDSDTDTPHQLPLTWQHIQAIQRGARSFSILYWQTQRRDDKTGEENYRNWMTKLFQIIVSIRVQCAESSGNLHFTIAKSGIPARLFASIPGSHCFNIEC